MTFFRSLLGKSNFDIFNHVSSEKVKASCSAPGGPLTCFQHLVGDSNGLKMQTKLFSPASMQYFCTKISIAKGTHSSPDLTHSDSKQRRHHNFRGRLITQQLQPHKAQTLVKSKKSATKYPSIYV